MQFTDDSQHYEPVDEATIEPVAATEISPQDAARLKEVTRHLEIAEVMAESANQNPEHDEHDGTAFYRTKMRDAHQRASQRERDRILNPGKARIASIKRLNNPQQLEREKQRYAEKVANETGRDVDAVRAEQDARREELELNRTIRAYLMAEEGLQLSGARKKLRRMTDEKKAEVQRTARALGYGPETREGKRPQPERVGVSGQPCPPLPAREQLRESTDPERCQSIIAQLDIDKALVRDTLQTDVADFIAKGREIEVLDPYFPKPKHCITLAGKRHMKSVQWGYVPNKPTKGRGRDC